MKKLMSIIVLCFLFFSGCVSIDLTNVRMVYTQERWEKAQSYLLQEHLYSFFKIESSSLFRAQSQDHNWIIAKEGNQICIYHYWDIPQKSYFDDYMQVHYTTGSMAEKLTLDLKLQKLIKYIK